ncbi:MAG: sodium:solute symporter, partial [Alistipes sp.]|nr:sodium:solute symporter [Alistipes sp.]
MTPFAVIITVFVYVIVLFVVSYFSGRHSDNAGFFVGNHRTTWYMSALAMISAAMSGVTYVSVPGSVAADSFSYLQMVMGFTAGQCILAFVMVPVFYRKRIVSLYEYLDDRFGITAHRTGAVIFLVSKILGASLKIFPVCAVMQLLVFDAFGVPFAVNVAATMILVWLYTGRGGVRSLIWTDSLKTLCLVSSLVLSILFITRAMGLSFAGMLHEIGASEYSRIFFFDDPSSSRYFWKMFWAGVFVLVAMTGLDQDMMQLNISCRTKRDAQINIMITALCQIAIIVMFLMLGVLLYMYAADAGVALPPKSDQLFAKVATAGGLPVSLGVVFVL